MKRLPGASSQNVEELSSIVGPDEVSDTIPVDRAEAEIGRQVRALVAQRLPILGFPSQRELFLERIERMAALIAFWGTRINLTAAPRDPQEIGFHLIDSLAPISVGSGDKALRDALGPANRILDMGSGAGFPGLVLASTSSARFTLVEGRRKRASFLVIAATTMGLSNVTVESRSITTRPGKRTRSPDGQQPEGLFDVVTGRAYSSPSIFHGTAAAALRPGGIAILYANPGQDLSLDTAEKNGLGEFRSLDYTVLRDHQQVERILGLWRRQ